MIEEKIVIGERYPLNGLLTIPDSGGARCPAAVLVHGSGPVDMDEKVGGTRFFKDLAQGLARRGVATIRYDKRTFAHGKKLLKDFPRELSVREETIEDALLAASLLRGDPRIDPEKVFIAGHSMGAMLAPRIDGEGGNFAGLVLLAGSPRRLEEIIVEQMNEYLKGARGMIKWIAGRQIGKIAKKLEKIYGLTDEEAMRFPVLGKKIMAYYFKEWGSKPAVDYLKDRSKPILVLQGDADFHVSVEKDFNGYKQILAEHANAHFKLYPGLNHLFMPKVYGDIKKARREYKKAQNVDERVIDDVADWIKAPSGNAACV